MCTDDGPVHVIPLWQCSFCAELFVVRKREHTVEMKSSTWDYLDGENGRGIAERMRVCVYR